MIGETVVGRDDRDRDEREHERLARQRVARVGEERGNRYRHIQDRRGKRHDVGAAPDDGDNETRDEQRENRHR